MADKIKMSAIRAQFPMYGDLSDEELASAVRRKFYADIPMDRFARNIEFDTEVQRASTLGDMSTGQRLAAGAGKAFTDIGRGVGQMLGMVSRDDVARARKLDAPLMDTVAGKVGNVAGSVAALLPTAFIPGANTMAGAAAIGAGTGLLAPSESMGETAQNVAMGGVAAPLGLAIGRGVGALYGAGKGLLQPLTASGQEKIVGDTLRTFAQDPAKAAAAMRSAKPLVPGSQPTMAQVARDPGLAQLERVLVNNPETGKELAGRFAEQRAARLAAIQNIAGTDEYYNAIQDGRSLFAAEDYAKAMASGFDEKALKDVAPRIEKIMARPAVQQAKRVASQLAANNDEEISEFGSVKGLDYLMKALDNQISKAQGPSSSIGKEELRALTATKNDLLDVIEKIAPDYKDARANFSAMSKQVNSMDVARELQKKYEPALGRFGANTREQASSYATALENAGESVKRQTGLNVPLAQIMPKGDIDALENVARDLGRQAVAQDLGRAQGSPTAQNFIAQNLLRRTLGPAGLPETWGESTALQTLMSPVTGLMKLGGAEQRVLDRITQAAMNPEDAAELMLRASTPSRVGLLGNESQRYLPAGLLGLLSGTNGAQ